MTRRRWIADEVSGDRALILGTNAHHLSRVLRAQVGQQFEIATPDGPRMGTILEIQPERVTFELGEVSKERATHSAETHLYLAVFKFDRFEWAVEKCTELGASSICPVIARRTESHLAAAAKQRVERWRRIAHEAAQQSRRDHAPEIRDPEKLDRAIKEAQGRRIVLAETETEQMLANLAGGCVAMSLAVGPEGGWTESELAAFASAGWVPASLGPTILRAETAAVAALAIAQACYAADSARK
jgi:16S rRNA (uracil1498-N3)-methyltransferase